ncbi:MAG: dihydroxyacetone kinase subunit L [Lachnospiraceae bacterium]|nr:dihydroxyacetone kinase subunit L [Lachnospiraceae bacterium]
MERMTREQLPDFFRSIASMFAGHAAELCEMDAKLGDGDLGLTMKKGFGALPEIAENLEEPDLGKAVMKCGMKLSSVIPSTMGFLMGSGLMGAGRTLTGKTEMTGSDLAGFYRGYADGIIKRGKCSPGDRTILDAVNGAASEAEKLVKEKPDAGFEEVAAAAEKGAEKGAEATRNMIPKFGKAAVHQEAAAGVRDQGAVAGFYLAAAIAEFGKEED